MGAMSSLAIIIPSKNESRFLPTLLRGLTKQTRQPDEVILADAQSTDSTRAIALEHGFKVVEGGMPAVGRNAGAKVAKSDLLLFLDADVILDDPKFLETAVADMDEQNLDIATVDIYLKNGTKLEAYAHKVYNRLVRRLGNRRPHAPGFCTFIRRELFEKIGGYDESVIFLEDHELATRASKVGRYGILNGVEVGVTDRRLRRDGAVIVLLKYILADLHLRFLGPIRHNYFHYDFGYDPDPGEKK